MDESRNDVFAKIVSGRFGRVGFERLHEDFGIEDIDTHRGQREIGRAGDGTRLLRFFLETGDPFLFVDRDDAEAARLFDGHLDSRQRGGSVPLVVKAQHSRVIHFVDVIARQNDEVARALAHDRVKVLVHGVRRTLVPLLADAFLRRQDLDELAELFGYDAPFHSDVSIEGE